MKRFKKSLVTSNKAEETECTCIHIIYSISRDIYKHKYVNGAVSTHCVQAIALLDVFFYGEDTRYENTYLTEIQKNVLSYPAFNPITTRDILQHCL